MAITLSNNLWSDIMDWAYDKALKGGAGMDKASVLAMRFSYPSMTLNEQVDALIRRQKILAGSTGFLTGLGGLMAMPFTIPVNFASVLYIQLRMIAAIAYMGGYDLDDKKVKTMIIGCMAGNAVKDIGLTVLKKTKGRTLVNFGKSIPLAGGIIGGSVDILTTTLVGRIARNTFISGTL